MIETLNPSISFELPDTTIALERSRNPCAMLGHELLQCFAGSIRFLNNDTGVSIISLDEVPLIRFAVDITDALVRLTKTNPRVTIVDFYGEFELALSLELDIVRLSESVRGQELATPQASLRTALHKAVRSLQETLLNRIPELDANSEFARIMTQTVTT